MSFRFPPSSLEDYIFWGVAGVGLITLALMVFNGSLSDAANPGRKGRQGTQWYSLAVLAGIALGFWFYHEQPQSRQTPQNLALYLIGGLCAGVVVGGLLAILTRPNIQHYEDRDPRADKAKTVIALLGFGVLFAAMFVGAQFYFR